MKKIGLIIFAFAALLLVPLTAHATGPPRETAIENNFTVFTTARQQCARNASAFKATQHNVVLVSLTGNGGFGIRDAIIGPYDKGSPWIRFAVNCDLGHIPRHTYVVMADDPTKHPPEVVDLRRMQQGGAGGIAHQRMLAGIDLRRA